MRIGHGYDVHMFAMDRKLILGGVDIPFEKGLAAHSDGDVLIHALCDALLGAAALGDIGCYFPDTDKKYENIDSRVLLGNVIELLKGKGLNVVNADITLIAQVPKMAPHISSMRKNIADDMGIEHERVNIKATTTEGLGYIGRQEGIAAHAVVLIE